MILKSLKVAPFGGLNPGAFVEKFGGDSLGETRRNYESYLSHVAARIGG